MKISTKVSLFVAIGVAITTYSCKKNQVAYEDMPTLKTEDKVFVDTLEQADAAFTQVYTVVHTEVSNVEEQAFKTGGALGLANDKNAKVDYEIDSTDKANKFVSKVTIDYPTASVWNGFTKIGKIVVTKNGKITTKGTMCNISFENFKINGMPLSGNPTLENKGFVNGVYTMALKMNNGVYAYAVKISLDLTLTFTLSNGSYALAMSGTESITTGGRSCNINYLSPLLRSLDCNFITKGVKEIKEGSNKSVLDYGDGTCDNKSTFLLNGTTYQYTQQ
ncbi:MAG: hypothetical protein NT150_02250 [Bacteroidetes bacterium]|nr:hypothetical protein [Bacteroidota bacterium]